MKHLTWLALFLLIQAAPPADKDTVLISLTREGLRDKIMGGWAGQTIGVTFGGPTEFRFNGTMMQEYQKIDWHDGYLKETFEKNPGLYDDLYMDLTFVEVFEKEGINAPATSFAKAYAEAGYMLWHANQAGRYNILHGIDPPASGHWLNNPHADDIDFQIEADFAGLMCPGMPQSASQICDKVGHIMNYGDGYYGGLYIANLYALAFTSNKMGHIVREAIKSIPERSTFHQCIRDVIRWHHQYPGDWKRTWFEIQKRWAEDIGCPDGVYSVFDIDAKLNAAYVTLGLLYGEGDFTKTMEITTRAGQDSDCNPSSAGGILGVVLGYQNIPDLWKAGLKDIEGLDFKYTTMSLNDAYEASFRQALSMISENGGKVRNGNVVINVQKPVTAKWERSFEGHFPIEKRWLENKVIEDSFEFDFEGIGFVLRGEAAPWNSTSDHVIHAELYLNNKFVEKAALPASFTTRRSELFWKYQLPHKKHHVKIKVLNPSPAHPLRVTDVVVYDVRSDR
ncbi:ADP-ribosylglycohydrolase family protein [Fulvivirgaceae bacterium PWU4]|uniref:ADP-ribosylglycohydrolase family protein n=1 Tax=Chryseosolibacter histidini TaxID=2782349 RepID=A0AAP2DHH7_9BACT|nr:ADP-ribosylglycohydrolase family protein [Chryseosolibacter histidini]MBT1696466.1 ADP-ribosylglycohydrolase family protein [Chryseosolibacter histidini]